MSPPTAKLIACIKQNSSVELIRRISWRVSDLNKPDDLGVTPLNCAIQQNNYHAVQLLLQLGADVNTLDIHARNSLHVALELEALDIVPLLLVKKPRTDTVSLYNHSDPLGLAIELNDINLMESLLRLNSLHGLTTNLSPALMKAIAWTRPKFVEILLVYGADINAQEYGMGVLDTFLFCATNCQAGQLSDPLIHPYDSLIAYHAKLPYENMCKQYASSNSSHQSEMSLSQIYDLLIEYFADIKKQQAFPQVPQSMIEYCPPSVLSTMVTAVQLPDDALSNAFNHSIKVRRTDHAAVIVRHVALFHSNPIDEPRYEFGEFEGYYQTCLIELGQTKSQYIDGKTYYEILIECRTDQVQKYRLKKSFTDSCLRHFPIYTPEFLHIIEAVCMYRKLFHNAMCIIGKMINIDAKNHPDILEQIMFEMKSHDLRSVIFSAE